MEPRRPLPRRHARLPARTFQSEIEIVETRYRALDELIRDPGDGQELHWRGCEVLEAVEAVTCACLLLFDATVNGQDEAAVAVAQRWVSGVVALPRDRIYKKRDFDWKEEVRLDRLIFLGDDMGNTAGIDAGVSRAAPPVQSKL